MSRVTWLSPSPLWDDLAGGAAFRRPAVLRFASDTFMADFQATLATAPVKVRGYVARPETWRRPAVGLPPRGSTSTSTSITTTGGATDRLKLYQAVHGRFYLVTASLACRVPGLPEHTVDLAAGETVAFVLRRVRTDSDGTHELAWVKGDAGTGWTEAAGAAPLDEEERLPMFGTFFQAGGLTRRLFAGFIPVDRREQYVGGREVTLAPADGSSSSSSSSSSSPTSTTVSSEDPRVLEFQRSVLDPWTGLLEWYEKEMATGDTRRMDAARTSSEQASALMLLDLATFLQAYLPDVWDAFQTPAHAASLSTAQRAFHDAFGFGLWNRNSAGTGVVSSPFRQALLDADDSRDDLEANTLSVGSAPSLPSGYSPRLLTGDPHVSGLSLSTQQSIDADEQALHGLLDRDLSLPEEAPGMHRRPVVQKLLDALQEVDEAGGSPSTGGGGAGGETQRPPTLPPLDAQGDDAFVVRCVYARPNCGKKAPPVLSDASEPFLLASFFDADAPQRPLRVSLPIDTTPAGLRKYDRNVAFLLSNELRKQMSRVKGMKELMDGDVGDPGGIDISVICSLSIPIITICALIVLMLMVSLLNIVFWWLPFFILCFPVPSLRAKE